MKYSIVIPSFNSKKTILNCLESVLKEVKFSIREVEVIVVDSSSDDTAEVVKDKFPEIKLIKLKSQTYQGKARNIGAEVSQGEFLVFIDSDCILREGYLHKLDTLIDKNLDRYKCFGGITLNGTPNSIVGTAMYLLQFRDFLFEEEMGVKNLPATNLTYRKEEFLSLGGFPEDLASSEESEFNFSFSLKYGILFSPEIGVYHINRTELKGFLLHQIKNGFNFQKFKMGRGSSFFSRISKNPFFIPFFPFYRFLKGVNVAFRNSTFARIFPLSILLFSGFFFYSLGELLFFVKPDFFKVNRF